MTRGARFFPDERFRIRAGRVIAIASIVLGTYALVTIPALGLQRFFIEDYLLHQSLPAVAFGVFALLAVPRQPFNNSVWVALWAALAFGLSAAGNVTGILIAVATGIPADLDYLTTLTPAELPTVAALFYSLLGLVLLGFILILAVGLMLFPNGRLPSRRWRWLVWGSILTGLAFVPAIGHEFRPSSTTPLGAGIEEWTGWGRFVDELTLMAALFSLAGLVSLVLRYRLSSGVERQQYRWMAYGGGVLIFVLLGIAVAPGPAVPAVGGGLRSYVQIAATLLGLLAVLSAYAIAVGKYRLYDIDIVISRTFVYGSLALFISAVYVGIVVGAGRLLQSGGTPDLWLGIAATVVIAIAFQPLRRQLQRVANRMVYGRRATPYEVLSSFSQQMAAIDPGVLGQVARMLTAGTTANAASIWVVRKQRLHRIAGFPGEPGDVHVAVGESIPKADQTAEVRHDGDRLGLVALELSAGQPFPPVDRTLLDQVAAGLGLALRNLQLTDHLRAQVDELRESRRRVVAVQDQTRQMLERDLHDGAQQRLVALKIKVSLGAAMAQRQHLADVSGILETVRSEADLTIESLRDLARGIYPPLLESEGLAAALTAQLRRAPLPVTVQAAGIGRQPREIEATVYFCVLEAVQNAIKHARAKSVLVTVTDDDEMLHFEVRDDGVGFKPTPAGGGSGLQNMADRLDALNGTLEIVSTDHHGTRLIGALPVREPATI